MNTIRFYPIPTHTYVLTRARIHTHTRTHRDSLRALTSSCMGMFTAAALLMHNIHPISILIMKEVLQLEREESCQRDRTSVSNYARILSILLA